MADRFAAGWGLRVFALGAVTLGAVGLAFGDFAAVWQPVPADVPHRIQLAYAVGAALALGGVALAIRRTSAIGAAMLTLLYGLNVVLVHGARVAVHPASFAAWDGLAEQLALAAAAVIALAATASLGPRPAAGLTRAGRFAFGVCLLSFGAAHFVYLKETAPLVPGWLPLGGTAWAWTTGAAHIAAGLAILSGVLAGLAARLLTLMFVIFGVLVHAPALLSDPHSHFEWAANAINLSLVGAAWVVADSFKTPWPRRSR